MPDASVTEIEPRETCVLIRIIKRVLNEQATHQLVDDIHTAAVDHPVLPIVLDMSAVKFAPSIALGALVKLCKSFEFDGRRFDLIVVDRNLRDAMRVTHLDKMLNIQHSLDDVLAALAKKG